VNVPRALNDNATGEDNEPYTLSSTLSIFQGRTE
jgi:hypothetical protein